jgi:hypothetical protein
MKYIFILLVTLIFNSCSFTNYYQLHQISSETNSQSNNITDKLGIEYDFWSSGGQVMISIENKTNKEMIVDLERSYFIKNGISYQFYANESNSTTYASSTNYSTKNQPISQRTISLKEEYTKVLNESKNIYIAPRSKILISKFKIQENRLIICDLKKIPNESKTVSFSKENSPINLRYFWTVYSKSDTLNIESDHFVKAISNHKKDDFINTIDTTVCGTKLPIGELIEAFKFKSSNSFYVMYE